MAARAREQVVDAILAESRPSGTTPDKATAHRGCDGKLGGYDFSILFDVSTPTLWTAYVVLSDWLRHGA